MRIRYVDGSGVVPRGVQVVIVEGVEEVVIQMDMTACPTLLMDALTETVTAWANERFLYVGPGHVVEYAYELAHLPGEGARVVVEPGKCTVLVDPTVQGRNVLRVMSQKVTAAALESWVWVGPAEVVV